MLEIASGHSETGVYQKDIAKNQDISNKYLDHIIHGLKVAEFITKKGKKGGYILTRKPSEITVYDVNNAFEPGICVIECLNKTNTCQRENGCTARGFWSNLNRKIIDHFVSVTLEDLLMKREMLDDSECCNQNP